jgi:hypothetical protein
MKSLDPLKKAKELLLIGEINLKLSQSFELDNEESSESKRVIKPIEKHKHSQEQ